MTKYQVVKNILANSFKLGLLVLLLAACNLQPDAPTPSQPPHEELSPQFTGWAQLGGVANIYFESALPASQSSVVLDSAGNPTVVWRDSGLDTVYVTRWTGTTWQYLGQVSSDYAAAYSISMVLDSLGNPIVAYSWLDRDAPIYGFLGVKRWNGSGWEELNLGLPSSDPDGKPYLVDIEIDSQNNLVLAVAKSTYGTSLHKWTGAIWTTLAISDKPFCANGGYSIHEVSLALDANEVPLVAVNADCVSTTPKTYVKYVNNGALVNLGSNPINIGTGESGKVSLVGGAFPTVAWTERNVSDINGYHSLYVKQWNGNAWVSLGADGSGGHGLELFNGAANPSLATNAQGDIALVYQEVEINGNYDIWNAKRWNASGPYWEIIGGFARLDIDKQNGNALNPSLALAANGDPTVSWQEAGNIYVKQYQRDNFAPFGLALDKDEARASSNATIARSTLNQPIVAFQEDTGQGNDIYVRRWNNTNWDYLGNTLDVSAANDAVNPDLVTTSSGNPLITWQEKVGSSWDVYVKAWNGTNWAAMGNALDKDVSKDAETPSLAVDTNNRPVVTWSEFSGISKDVIVKRWNGSIWQQLGGILDKKASNDSRNPMIAIDKTGKIVVAWEEYDFPRSTNIYVKRWNGTTWTSLGGALDKALTNNSFTPSLAIDSSNRPVVTWHEQVGASFDVYAKRFNGTSWQFLGGTIDNTTGANALYPDLQIDTNNNPVISWEEQGDIFVKRWTGSVWQQIGATRVDSANLAAFPALMLNTDNQPVVVFQEDIAGQLSNLYVKGY